VIDPRDPEDIAQPRLGAAFFPSHVEQPVLRAARRIDIMAAVHLSCPVCRLCGTEAGMRGRTRSLLGALAALVASPALAGEDPDGCNATAVSAVLSAYLDGEPVPPGECLLPGEVLSYQVVLFVPFNFPPFAFCDVIGGQLSVTFPNWWAQPPPPFVPAAGYPDTEPITQFGNIDGAGVPFVVVAPQTYVVEASDAVDGLLHARADYGQTAFIKSIGHEQENGTFLSDPDLPLATAIGKSAVGLCVPDIDLEMQVRPAQVCAAVESEVTFTYTVSNHGEVDLSGVTLDDAECPPTYLEGDVNADARLNPGELWTYDCTMTVSSTLANTAAVSALGVSYTGDVVEGVVYTDAAEATVVASDDVPPEFLACPPEDILLVADKEGEATMPDLAPLVQAEDECTPAKSLELVQKPPAGAIVTIGRTPATVEVGDLAGNVASCATVITVVGICAGDVNLDHRVDVQDLVMVIFQIGVALDPGKSPADVTDDGEIDVLDIAAVILSWGPC
jgi:hypothetical protein